ncbi:hypothetical protein CDL12_13566 [Handroanthus impetiginosus]|uniref:Uncharacterized protein n=1 Tax=Handroanthus impetiginosus TaxID=429701 RepID=A0A2G9H8F2_9LAMI|nr:hypothetical protein CDL12_13566 [Handroanthus impetiginosus]
MNADRNSIAAPQMCNKFIGWTVNIYICQINCNLHFHGRGMCISVAPPPAEHRKPTGKRCCHCKCTFPKKPNRPCPEA